MDEQAFLAKMRRALLSRATKVLPAGLMGRLPLTPAETAAHALRVAPKENTATAPITTFLIPLVGKHQVSAWSVVDAAFTICAQALIHQSDPNWRALVCSQDRPSACDLDPRIQFVPFNKIPDGHDKIPKLETLTQHALKTDMQPGFVMPLDGDDLLHVDFVQILNRCDDKGLLVSAGLILNSGNGDLCETQHKTLSSPLQKPFWKFCGSCAAFPVGRAPDLECSFIQALCQHEHRLYPHLAKLAGIELYEHETPLAIYLINHGENFETRRGRGGFKQRFARRFAMSDEKRREALKAYPAAQNAVNLRTSDL
jgi:hypothetical protein